jgi:diguanylate cyclase (GGDEF)-like protein
MIRPLVFVIWFLMSGQVGWAQKLYAQEAEKAFLHPMSEIHGCDECSGKAKVQFLGWNDRWAKFIDVSVPRTGFYSVFLWVENHEKKRKPSTLRINNRQQSIFWVYSINGYRKQNEKVHVRAWLQAGLNTVEYGHPDDWALALDKLEIWELQDLDEAEYFSVPQAPILSEITFKDWDAIFILVIGIVFSCITCWLTWRQRKRWALHTSSMLATVVACGLAQFFQILELLDQTLTGSAVWTELSLVATVFFVGSVYVFALRYSGNQAVLKSAFIKIWMAIMWSFPLILVVIYTLRLGFADSWEMLTRDFPFEVRNDNRTMFKNLAGSFQTMSGALALSTLTVFYNQVSRLYRAQITLVLLAGSSSFLVGGALYAIFETWGWQKGLMYLYAFSISSPLFTLAVWRYRLATFSPEIWGESAEVQTNMVIATNKTGVIVESNQLAKTTFDLEVGKPLKPALYTASSDLEYAAKHYQVQVHDLHGQMGRLHVLNDVTELKQTQQQLAERNLELVVSNQNFERSNEALLELQAKLREQVIRDGLTGIYNRHHLSAVLAQWADAQYSLMLFDVDRFREFNSRFGFMGGDAVLKAIGDFLLSKHHTGLIPFRYGGEEFCVFFLGTHLQGLVEAKALQSALGNLIVPFAGQSLSFTVSSSFASTEQHGKDILAMADENLRFAKQRGRNQLVEAVIQKPIWVKGWA